MATASAETEGVRQHRRFTKQDGEAAAGRAALRLYGHALSVEAAPASAQLPLRPHMERSPDHVGDSGSRWMVADRFLLPDMHPTRSFGYLRRHEYSLMGFAALGDHLLFSILTTEANAVVAPIHEKAMPVLLLDDAERETWLRGSMEEALALQRPAPAETLKIVTTGAKKDGL